MLRNRPHSYNISELVIIVHNRDRHIPLRLIISSFIAHRGCFSTLISSFFLFSFTLRRSGGFSQVIPVLNSFMGFLFGCRLSCAWFFDSLCNSTLFAN